MEIQCDLCGYVRPLDRSIPGAIVGDKQIYGHHDCPDGRLGSFLFRQNIELDKFYPYPGGEYKTKTLDKQNLRLLLLDVRCILADNGVRRKIIVLIEKKIKDYASNKDLP